jgi:peptidoglycan/LPS O-acetylase OafA/YrhL
MQLKLGSLADEPGVLIQDVLLLQSFRPETLLTGIGPAWFLSAMLAFYAIVPVLAWVAHRLARNTSSRAARCRAALVLPAFMLLLGISGKLVSEYLVPPGPGASPGWDANWHSVLERSLWVQADRFAFGLAVAVVWIQVHDGVLRLPRWWRWAATAVIVVLAPVAMTLNARGALSDHFYDTLLAFNVGLLLAVVVLPDDEGGQVPPLTRLLQTRPVEAFGLISFSFYLWHEPLLRWMAAHGLTLSGRAGYVVNLAIVGLIASVLSVATYRLIEQPVLRLKVKRIDPAR